MSYDPETGYDDDNFDVPEEDRYECPKCHGDGEIEQGDGWTLCPLCEGAGWLEEDV